MVSAALKCLVYYSFCLDLNWCVISISLTKLGLWRLCVPHLTQPSFWLKKTFCNIWRTVSNRDLLITKNYFTSRIYGICWLKMPCLLPLLLGFKVVRHIDGWPLIHLSFHSSLWDTVYEKFNHRLPAQNGIWVKCMAKNSFIIHSV